MVAVVAAAAEVVLVEVIMVAAEVHAPVDSEEARGLWAAGTWAAGITDTIILVAADASAVCWER